MNIKEAIGPTMTPEIVAAHEYALSLGLELRSAGLGGGLELDYGPVAATCTRQCTGHYSITFRASRPRTRARQIDLAYQGHYVDLPTAGPRFWWDDDAKRVVRYDG